MSIVVVGGLAESLLNFRGPLLATMVRDGARVWGSANGDGPQVAERLSELGVAFRPVRVSRAGLNPLEDLVTFASLIRLLRSIKPDLVLAYTVKPVIYGLLACRVLGITRRYALITGLGYSFTGRTVKHAAVRQIVRALYRAALRGAPKVIFQNPDDMRLFQELGVVQRSQCALVNGSGVDLERFAFSAPKAEPVRFLLIARLLGDKGIREYVDAARNVSRKHPTAEFLLVGPRDPNPAAIKGEEIARWRREGVVRYLGPLEDVRPALEQASVYVLPSYREGTPRTVLEAMSTGRAIVTTDAPGCKETVREGVNGFLVPVRDVAALEAAMERFIQSPELIGRMGRKSREMAEEKYDVRKVNASILTILGITGEEAS